MKDLDSVQLLKMVDFGDIDGLYDKNITEYFIDDNYWNQIVEGNKFFVIGRKGTGKSAIYNWIKKQEAERGVIVSNLSFRNFPFEKLLKLADDDFCRPNQYQSVWRNIILSEIAKQIVTDENNHIDDTYREIKRYVNLKFGTDLSDLHKKVTKQTTKTSYGLFIKDSGIGSSTIVEGEYSDDFSNITMINNKLEELIKSYLKTSKGSFYIIQFDQLDDNYTVFVENNEYLQSIISLFKVIYDLNQVFYQIEVPVKVIGYLRSDIFYEINQYDAESARWDHNKLYLNWAIINRSDWNNAALLRMLNKRIVRSNPQLSKYNNPFGHIFSSINMSRNSNHRQSVFSYIVHCSFQRPRDVIQFCIKIQEDSKKWGTLNVRNVLDAEKNYSQWLLTEVSNEFGPLVKDKQSVYELLRSVGDGLIDYYDFVEQYKPFQESVALDAEAFVRLLYRLGIIFNVNVINQRQKEYFSIIRNEQSTFDKRMKMLIHPGIQKGLHFYTK